MINTHTQTLERCTYVSICAACGQCASVRYFSHVAGILPVAVTCSKDGCSNGLSLPTVGWWHRLPLRHSMICYLLSTSCHATCCCSNRDDALVINVSSVWERKARRVGVLLGQAADLRDLSDFSSFFWFVALLCFVRLWLCLVIRNKVKENLG